MNHLEFVHIKIGIFWVGDNHLRPSKNVSKLCVCVCVCVCKNKYLFKKKAVSGGGV